MLDRSGAQALPREVSSSIRDPQKTGQCDFVPTHKPLGKDFNYNKTLKKEK